ncbi:MAG: PQQ-binding-like beta-propeller repeat protein, partial [Bdellovibrionales bacterium]|nr:PQQ-binding-like beta-propeller repeat protein [Bdellovibrionales bacterium]
NQNVISYAVGLGLDFDLLDDFAVNGGSSAALRADTASEISDALQSIVSMIISTPVSGAGASLAESFGEEGRVYRPRFSADTWKGNIDLFVYNDETEALDWQFDMGDMLEDRDISVHPRIIIAGYDPDHDGQTDETIEFSTYNKAALRPELFQLFDDGTLDSSLLAAPLSTFTDDDAAETLIQFIHGTDFQNMRTRDRDEDGFVEKLGDIVYSRPVEVGPRNGNYSKFAGYNAFTSSLKSQQNILVVGANDGALHAFDAQTGDELWAYIPSSQLKHLEKLSRKFYNRQYRRSFVDGQISVEDVYIGNEWKTLLMFGLRKGGSTYTVLDITDRDNPELLWEVSPEVEAGESWSKPVVVPYASSNSSEPGNYNWYMVVGTGEGKSTSGTNIVVYDLDSTSPPSPTVVSIASSDAAGVRTSSVAASNNDNDKSVDRLYVGTENGDLYRVQVEGVPAAWSVQKLYNGSATHPIVATPALALVDGANGLSTSSYAVGVYWGTGRYDEREDITGVGSTSQRIFGVFDPTSISSDTYGAVETDLTLSDLQNQTMSSFNVTQGSDKVYRLPNGKKGFYINTDSSINLTGEGYIDPVGMTVYEPVNLRGAMLFATFL